MIPRVVLPDNDLPKPPPSPFFTFQMPLPSIAKRQVKQLRSLTPSGHNPFLVSSNQFPAGSIYASSPVSKPKAAEDSLPSSDDLVSVLLELKEEQVVDNEMDIDHAASLEQDSRIEEEDDVFSD
jgi:hypothetical protein